MHNINELFEMLDSDNDAEVQAAGIEEAKQIQYFSILFQPAENKSVWQNCAKAIVAKSDSELHEYILNMFEWLKDLNWPGSAIILERLKQFPSSTIGYWLSYSIKKAVKEKDALWLMGLACLCTDPKIYNQLMYFAELKGMKKEEADEAIKNWAKKLKVEEYLDKPAEKLSKGNQQKIQFMTAVIHNPELLVLDEPFSGLDPVNTELLKNIIINLVKEGKYIIMSAHQMSTIEEFCSDILILNKGKTVIKGNLKEIKDTYPANRVQIETNENIETDIKKLGFEIENIKNYSYTVKIFDEQKAHELLKELVIKGITINKFEIMKPTLNDIFIEKVGE